MVEQQETRDKESKMYSDAPINDATYFNFGAYSEVISKIILNKENKTPFSIAINGKWGRGKTTLMRTIREKIKNESGGDNRKVKSVWFSAWKYSETDSMLAALVSEIFEEMRRDGLADKVKAMMVSGKRINILKVVSDAVRTLTMGQVEFDKWLEDQAYKKEIPFYDVFQDYMKKILMTFVLKKEEGVYSDKDGVLVIFIDDLDRCPPKQITKVLESINLFFDQEGCFFVFGVDISLISEAIDRDYNNLEGFTGIDYIKKMIQLQFDLPEIEKQGIKEFMENELNIEETLEEYFELIIEGLESNQREIKRFLNSLNLMRMVGGTIKNEKFEYREELLIKWSILNFSSKEFIKEVNKNPELMIKMQEFSNKTDEAESYIEALDDSYKRTFEKFIDDKKILNILQKGDEKFNESDIRKYIFLSSVAPKEPEEVKKIKKGAVYLRGEELQGVNLHGANLWKRDLRGADLWKRDLHGAILREANLQGVDLREANLQGADLREADLQDATIDEKCLETILKSKEWEAAYFDPAVKATLKKMAKGVV